MKIAFVQRYAEVGNTVQDRMEARGIKPTLELFRTNDPREVLELIRSGEQVFVVSGNCFPRWEANTAAGSILAAMVKDLAPETIFLMYSTLPTGSPHVDGYVPKDNSHTDPELLIRLFSIPEEDVKIPRLKEMFPEIKWRQ